ncbi:EamA family transporter [Edwardsiella ictaluri]|nr:EamA family transporter [Edwardsiella ictaluri]WFO12793.1 EamA family transporter [Edwardsiella ictaluri]
MKYLEPAVVGIASVACGPALTLIISRYIIKDTSHPTKYEGYAAWVILTSVVVMLVNSYVGKSGVTDTTTTERIIGISCVVLSAIGTVLYTFFSKRLSTGDWKTYEILGVRNILMLLVTLFYMFSYEISFLLNKEMLLIILSLSIIGHILPVFLIQSSIATLDPIHVSLILLLLPIFTLLFQFFDPRIHISSETFITVIMITFLLIILSIVKLQKIDKDER